MKRLIALVGVIIYLYFVPMADAAWTEVEEFISGGWGSGKGQFGMRSEGGLDVLPSIEVVANDDRVIIHDPVNRRLLIYDRNGALSGELKQDGAGGKDVYARSTLQHLDRSARTVVSQKAAADSFSVTAVFADRNSIVTSNQEFRHAMRDQQGNVYGLLPRTVLRFDKNSKQTDVLDLPSAHEELVTIPGKPVRGVYVIYGEPVVGPSGNVYLWKKTNTAFIILKWTWK